MLNKIFLVFVALLLLSPNTFALNGDLDDNGVVDFNDFDLLADCFEHSSYDTVEGFKCSFADFNGDGVVNEWDAKLFEDDYWGVDHRPKINDIIVQETLSNGDKILTERENVMLQIIVSDEDVANLKYAVSGDFHQTMESQQAIFVWNTEIGDRGTHDITITVEDVDGYKDSKTIQVKIEPLMSILPETADLDNDNDVDFDDFFLFADQYGAEVELDFDGDGDFDMEDFTLFAEQFGQTIPEEPTCNPEVIISEEWTSTGHNGEECGDLVLTNECEEQNIQETRTCSVAPEEPTCDENLIASTEWTSTGYEEEQCGDLITTNDCGTQTVQETKTCSVEPEEPVITSADFNDDGVVNGTDFEYFKENFGLDNGGDLNGDNEVDFDDFFLFADQFGQEVEIPDVEFKLINFSPIDQTEGVSALSRIFSLDSSVEGNVKYEFFLAEGGLWNQGSINQAALDSLKDLTYKTPRRTVTTSDSNPEVTITNFKDYTTYFWKVKATDSEGNVYVSPILKFSTHVQGSSTEFVPSDDYLEENKAPTASIVRDNNNFHTPINDATEVYTTGKGAHFSLIGSGSDEDGSVVSYEWLIDGIAHYKGSDKDKIDVAIPKGINSGNYEAKFRVQDDEGAWSGWEIIDLNVVDKFAPNKPFNPSPADKSAISEELHMFGWEGSDDDSDLLNYKIIIARDPGFTWGMDINTLTWNDAVYSNNPNYGIGDLDINNNYWWRLIVTDSDGLTTYGDVWSFGPDVFEEPEGPSTPSDGDDDNEEPEPTVYGCTDPNADNHNAAANQDDGSCAYVVLGCTDNSALNYNSNANQDDGSCTFAPVEVLGCMDSTATNYNAAATQDDNSCTFVPVEVLGCMDSTATNYNSAATQDDGSCTYTVAPILGCTDVNANNYNSAATQDDESCTYTVAPILGCTNVNALNYNALATQDDGNCVYAPTPNQAPVLTPIGNKVINEGESVTIVLSATDAEGDALSFSRDVTFGSVFGNTFTWNTDFEDAGVYTIVFTVSDGEDTDSETITITVNNVNQAPVLNIPSRIVVDEGDKVVLRLAANDPDDDEITYNVNVGTSKLVRESELLYTWQTWYEDSGIYTAWVTIATADGKSDTQEVKIVVRNAVIKHPKVEVDNIAVMNIGGIVESGEALEIYLNIGNNGNTNNENARVSVTIPELSIYEELGIFSLDKGSNYLDIVDIDLGNEVQEGKEYYYFVKAESDDASDLKYGSFIVE